MMHHHGFLTPHDVGVLTEATARLIPGPLDEPEEAGSPGARQANVVSYIGRYLDAFDHKPTLLFAAGPWSTRSGGEHNGMATFVDPTESQSAAWHDRIDRMREQYRSGIALLDRLAGGDFTSVDAAVRDEILSNPQVTQFRDVLFDHAIEGMYGIPEYGGNENLEGWRSIGYRGDTQPDGYRDDEVSKPDPPDPVIMSEVVQRLVERFDSAVWHGLGGGVDD